MVQTNTVSIDTGKLRAAELVDEGLVQHRQGNLDHAARLYQTALEQDQQQSDALHLLGMIAFQLNQPDKAEQLIKLAIQMNSKIPVYHNNLGNIYLSQGSVVKAIEAYQRAVSLKQNYAEARFNLGNAYLEFGELGLAEIFYLRALEIAPDFPLALKNLAELYVTQFKWPEAKKYYELLHELEPNDPIICQRLSDLLTVLEANVDQRVYNLQRALTLYEGNLDACLELANWNTNQSNFIEAGKLYEHALKLDPKNSIALFGKANILKAQKKLTEAALLYRQIVDIDSEHLDARYNLANTYKDLAKLPEAEIAYQDVLSRDPGHFGALVNLGVVKSWGGQFNQSLECLDKAQAINSENYILQNNLGMAHHFLRNFELAKSHYIHAMKIEDTAEAKWNLSLTLLAQGNFIDGFALYENRWQLPELLASVKRNFLQPLWKGEKLNQKTILVYFEQGYGDAIQFCRLLPELVTQGARVVFEVPPALYRLMQHIHPDIKVIRTGEWPGSCDYQSPIMSLPYRMALTLETIPSHTPYLAINKDESKPELKAKGMKIGVAWAGNPREHNLQSNMFDKRRSCPVDFFEQLTDIENTHWISLQKEGELPLLSNIKNVMQDVTDFQDTAEIINQLDLVITVDTAVAHLAGALNKPVWLLSRYDACWRWLSDRNDSPWYPSMLIFRQSSPGDWSSVFAEVRKTLEHIG